MFHRSLPATYASGDKKGQTANVQIANSSLGYPADEKGPDGTIVEKALRIEQSKFVFPQFGPQPKMQDVLDKDGKVVGQEEAPLTVEEAEQGIKEAIDDAGGPIPFLAIHNDNTRDEAVKEAKTYIRQYEGKPDTDVLGVIAAGLKKALTFTWKASERVTVQQFRSELKELQTQNIDEMDPEELKARIKALLGQA